MDDIVPTRRELKMPPEVGLLGGGSIGGGWAAKFILAGVNVRLYDPAPGAAEGVQRILTAARRAYRGLTFNPLPAEGALTLVSSVADAVVDVEFVQESAPERLELKQQLIAEASHAAAAETLICSSTSGFLPSLLQARAKHPERVLVSHSFNPVYLLPLVEVCGGTRTDPRVVQHAAEIYRSLGMHPLVVRKETDGLVARRLQEVLWREAFRMVRDDVATVQEIDDVVRLSFGLRHPVLGPIEDYRIISDEKDTRKAFERLCRLLEPRTKLTDVPEFTNEFLDKLVAQSGERARDAAVADIEQTRDDCIVRMLRGLRRQNHGAGKALARWEREMAGRIAVLANALGPLEMPSFEMPSAWLDFKGHVSERRYLQLCGAGNEHVCRYLGIDREYRTTQGDLYTLETHLSHLGELHAGDRVVVSTQVLASNEKRLHLIHMIKREGDERLAATGEQMLIHVGATTGRSVPMQGSILERLEELARLHAQIPHPKQTGASVRMR